MQLAPVDLELADAFGRYSLDPHEFAYFAFPWGTSELEENGPRAWQCDILQSITDHLQSESRYSPLRIAVASGHGIGKSALIAMICGWAMSCYEDARVNVTANTGRQLDTKTWPEIASWFRRIINAHWWKVKGESIVSKEKAHEETWRVDAVPWSANNPAAFAGLHNKGRIVVLIMDEASEIDKVVWETSEGATTDENTIIIFVAFGNPTQNSGSFAECFGTFRHRWIHKHIDSRTVEGTNKEQLRQWVEDYGEDSDFVRVRVRGEFPRQGDTQFISTEVVQKARKRDVGDQSSAYSVMAVDVARFGGDQTVIGSRQGLRFDIIDRMRGRDTLAVGDQVVYRVKEKNPRALVIDGDGLGAGVVDYVRFHMADWMEARSWFRFVEFHGGGSPGDGDMYFNARAECWGLARNWLETGSIPDDAELGLDLEAPRYFFSSKSQIQLERKEDMKKRGLASPDSGDTLAMSFAVMPTRQTFEEFTHQQVSKVAKEHGATQANIEYLKLQAAHKKSQRWRRQY